MQQFTALAVSLALFCGIAHAGSPTNFVAELGDSTGDYVDVKLQWEAASCLSSWLWNPTYEIYQITKDGQKKLAVTKDLQATLQKVEYWTDYTFQLETKYCIGGADAVKANISTGPGNPHQVAAVHTEADGSSVTVTITEAVMPRIVDNYNLTVCNDRLKFCKNQMFARNSAVVKITRVSSEVTTAISDLVPQAAYNLTVVPLIEYTHAGEETTYKGVATQTSFNTKEYAYPVPGHFTKNITEANDHLSVEVNWEMVSAFEGPALAFYNLTLVDASGHVVASAKTQNTSFTFIDIPCFASLDLSVTPHFNFSGYIQSGTPGKFQFDTPDCHVGPPTHFQYAPLNVTNVVVGWDAPKNISKAKLQYAVKYCVNKRCLNKANLTDQTLYLAKLKANSLYNIYITAFVPSPVDDKVIQGDTLNDTFQTLAADWPAVTDIKSKLANSSDNQAVDYQVTWAPVKAKELSFYIVKVCESPKSCTSQQTTKTEYNVSLGYFRSYDVSVTAQYNLPLNQNVTRSATTKITTPGTTPSPVTNVTVSDITAYTTTLSWKSPNSLPEGVKARFVLTDSANSIGFATPNLSIELNKLKAFRPYNVSIQVHVDYQNATFKSNETFAAFTTDVAAPGPVSDVKVSQTEGSNTATVTWSAPANATANGPINFYYVRVFNAKNESIVTLTAISRNFRLPLPMATANYTFAVSAVNIDRADRELEGVQATAVLEFHGVDAPIDIRRLKRTATSLLLEIVPTNETSGETHEFYRVSVGSNDTYVVSNDPKVNVTGLQPYTNETVHVEACYSDTFCSASFGRTFLTNVGVPSAVRNLTSSLNNKTNPVFSWNAPKNAQGPLDGYELHLIDLTNPDVKVNVTLPKNQTSYQFNTTLEFERFMVSVRAFSNDLDNATERVMGVTAQTTCATSGFSVPKPENMTEVEMNSTSAEIEWDRPNYPGFKVTWFRVEIPQLNHEAFTQSTSLVVSGLKPYQKIRIHTYGCTAKNASACGQPRIFEAKTDTDVPSIPRSLSATSVNETTFTLQWKTPETPNGPIHGYKVAVLAASNKTEDFSWEYVHSTGDLHTYQVTGLTAATEYVAHLSAFNDNSQNEELDSAVVTIDFSTAGSGGFPTWLVVVLCVAAVAALVAVGVVVWRRKRAQQADDTEHLVHA